MNGNQINQDKEGNFNDNVDIPLQIPFSTLKKRGISVGSFRMTNEQSIIASENKKILLNKIITQVDTDDNRTSLNYLSPQRNIT